MSEKIRIPYGVGNLTCIHQDGRFQWSCGLRRGSAAVLLVGLWVRMPPETLMSVASECCVSLGRGLCQGPITRPEESYRVWCVWMNVIMGLHTGGLGPIGLSSHEKKKKESQEKFDVKKTQIWHREILYSANKENRRTVMRVPFLLVIRKNIKWSHKYKTGQFKTKWAG